MENLVTLRINEKGTATVTLNRTDHANSLNRQMQDELIDIFQSIKKNDEVKLVVLKAGKECTAFCGGADIVEMSNAMLMQGSDEQRLKANKEASLHFARMLDAVATCDKPIIGIVKHAAIGAGATLATLCNFVVAANDTKFGWPEWHMGLKPSVSAPYVAAHIGPGNAIRHFVSGEYFGVDEAATLGIVDRTCAPGTLSVMEQAVVRRFENDLEQLKKLKPSHRQTLGDDHSHPEMYPLVLRAQELFADRSDAGRKAMIEATAEDLAQSCVTERAGELVQKHLDEIARRAAIARASSVSSMAKG